MRFVDRAEMFDAECSRASASNLESSSSEELSLFLQHLLHSSSSSSSISSASLGSGLANRTSSSSSSSLMYSSSSSSQFKPTPLWQSMREVDGAAAAAAESSGMILSASGVFCSPEVRDGGIADAADGSIRRRRQAAVENDLDEFDCESEEGPEASEEAPKAASHRSSSKRSRAAEVHNLSEKRRRSRINEKMKALQNLIPNSNKTDKASMLDEAIEYLKQLQLQVQMLSMRNGLSLHPMYVPGVLPPLQMPQARMGFNEGNGLQPPMNVGAGARPVNQESTIQTSFGPSNQCNTLRQPIVVSSMANTSHSDPPYGLDSPNNVHQGPFPLSAAAEEIYKEDVLSHQQLHANHSARNPSGSILGIGNANSVEACLLHEERSQDMFPKDAINSQVFVNHLHSLHSGIHLNHEDTKIRTMDF
ncbi:hypothetical protein Syun_015257 [Stephania yunnanensis]|uniref:BHLH domain-containing protein n=1 Tax=Stephania yunnanensis TaxID=152371 RepID=A0AAP0JKZ6_9MAGN